MDRNRLKRLTRALFAVASLTTLLAAPAAAQSEIVLHAKNASAAVGDWHWVTDATAAGGMRMWNPDRGAGKLSSAFASPSDYFELTFNAEAGRAYRLWLRGKADNDAWTNDSVHVQFSGSVYASGGASYRIGTTDSASVSIEACGGCGVSGWGWEDNGYSGLGTLVYFARTGAQTVRVQRREDGVSIDQVVLSASNYLTSSPGATKNDSVILTAGTTSTTTTTVTAPATTSSTTSGAEIVIPVAAASTLRGNWQLVADSSAAGGARVWNPDGGAGKLSYPFANPSDYFDISFNAEAGRGYRLWIRGKAQSDFFGNDSVFVQFSGSVNAWGSYAYRIGSTDATIVSVEQGSGYGLSGWGWSDNGWDSMGPLVYFETTGPQKLRVQRREDGISIDQIVLSASTYLTYAPGKPKSDTTILTSYGTTTAPAPEPEPAPAPAPAPEPEPAPAPAPAPTSSGSGVRLRVMQWNIGHGRGTDGVYNIERQATWMAAQNPDVVILNEVEKYTSWGNEDQPARFKSMLQSKTGRTWYMHFIQEFGQWWSNGKGHLILSTVPFDSTGYATITQSSGLKGAGAVGRAAITVNGRNINLIVSHLDPYDSSMRLTQARDVINWSAGYAENRIVVGDMNAWPDQASILEYNKTYYDSWTIAANNGTATGISGISPFGATKSGRIDYIFYSKHAPNLVVLNSKTPDTRDSNGYMPSDHRPVVTTFEVR